MHPIHPMVVHFPIALLMTSVVFDLLAIRWRRSSLEDASLYTLIGGVIGAMLAVATGAVAEELVEETGVPEGALEIHEALGYVVLWIFVGLCAIRFAMRRQWIRERPALSVTFGLVGVVVLAAPGYSGGTLVYEFGAGVAPTIMTGEP